MAIPLLNIIIPTYRRPQFLGRAIDSALQAGPCGSVEVIVVPNGTDESWKDVAARYRHHANVIWEPIVTPHANVARNHGLKLAVAEFVRFLDDDDYLLPAAKYQLELIQKMSADICSGFLRSIDQVGTDMGRLNFPATNDFLCAAVSISGFTLPVGNLFRRTAIKNCTWDVSVDRAQDNIWMIELAALKEWSWVHCEDDVGVWFQHNLERTSSSARLTKREELIVRHYVSLHDKIILEGRINVERARAIGDGLWYYVHRGFPNHPIHWSRVGISASRISKSSRPPHEYFHKGLFLILPPLLSEWVLLPARFFSQMVKAVAEKFGYVEYRRKL